jgi:hypothetical protein
MWGYLKISENVGFLGLQSSPVDPLVNVILSGQSDQSAEPPLPSQFAPTSVF